MIGIIIAVLASAVIILIALRGTRHGTEVLCPNCDYHLVSPVSRCNECGDPIIYDSIRPGVRRIRKKALLLGVCGLALTALYGFGRVRQEYILEILPSEILIYASEMGMISARKELVQRISTGEISRKLQRRAIPILLEAMDQSAVQSVQQEVDALESMRINGTLDKSQVSDYLNGIVRSIKLKSCRWSSDKSVMYIELEASLASPQHGVIPVVGRSYIRAPSVEHQWYSAGSEADYLNGVGSGKRIQILFKVSDHEQGNSESVQDFHLNIEIYYTYSGRPVGSMSYVVSLGPNCIGEIIRP